MAMTAPDSARARSDVDRNTELLDAELPSHRFVDSRYLHWLYHENPYGDAIQRSVDDESGVRIGHYALIPQHFRGPDGVVPAAFSLNAVVRSGGQRKGLFTQMGLEIFFAGQTYHITSDRLQILNLLLSTYETAIQKNHLLVHAQDDLQQLNTHLEEMVAERTAALRIEIAEHSIHACFRKYVVVVKFSIGAQRWMIVQKHFEVLAHHKHVE